MKEANKVLILAPASTARGGITNYYQVLRKEFPENIEYFLRGARNWPYRKGIVSEMIRAYRDYSNFRKRILQGDIGLVQTSTSLGFWTTIRDGLFVKCAFKHKIKTIVFFRGWDDQAVSKVQHYLSLFRYFFFPSYAIITLSEKSKKDLHNWGYRKDIFIETTLVDKDLLVDVDEQSIVNKYSVLKGNAINLLYFSRVEIRKGIYDLLSAYEILTSVQSANRYSLSICGDGKELDNIKDLIDQKKLKNVHVMDFVEGVKKKSAFENAHLLVFPSYGEGMPNAVLEAMGFGLPVLTTPVGGITDFFKNGVHGYYIKPSEPADIVKKIALLLSEPGSMHRMAIANYKLASELFRSDMVSERIAKIFRNILQADFPL